MIARPGRPAFYAPAAGGRLADAVTLLHPPYTLWHLSYFAIGAAVAPHVHVDRLLWGLAAFALAVGVAAHALDELHDRPLRTGFSDLALRGAALLSLLGALAIGIAGAVTVSAWLAPLIVLGGLLVPAYNLELAEGRFHSDVWFALGWGAFPAFTGYFVNALGIDLAGVLVVAGCTAMSIAQRRLSSAARELRRRTASVQGVRERADGSTEPITLAVLLGPLDGALAMLSLTVPLLATGMLAVRL
jgi:hypothetical protein